MKMRTRRTAEQGFTLIELLIVVAILGILAAVVIPNMGRLLGGGERTARNNEYESVKTSVVSMMVDNNLASLPNPLEVTDNQGTCTVNRGTQDMALFPDESTLDQKGIDPNGNDYSGTDKIGFVLFEHDIVGNGTLDTTALVNYVETQLATYCYTVTANGEVTQWDGDTQTNP